MAQVDVVHVAVAPPATFDEELIKKVAATVGKTHYETRLKLTGKIPKIIANYYNVQRAETAAQSLRELGLLVIVISDSELHKPPQLFKARNLKFEERAITFCDRAGRSKKIEDRELFLILSGKMQTYTETEVTTSKRKLNVPVTLLLGGIPIRKTVKEKITKKSFKNESFIRLYYRMPSEPAVEILQHDFDYSFLGPEMGSSAANNYGIAVRKIREVFPQAIFDDRLTEPFGADMSASVEQDAIEANCKLIYRYHQAVSGVAPEL